MTLISARKLLGKDCEKLSDVELQKHVEVAELLKEVFFKLMTSKHDDIVVSD